MKLVLISLCLILVTSCTLENLQLYSFTSRKMGVDFRIDLYASSPEVAEKAVAAAFKRIDDINSKMSDYIVDSELWKLSETSGKGIRQKVSPEMWEVLTYSKKINELSGGAFDITAGPYVLLWRKARVIKQLPDERSMLRAANKVGMSKIKFNEVDKTVELSEPKMRLDLGGVAKGYAADEALKTLKDSGIRYAMVDGSGDISMTGHPHGSWQVYISNSEEKSSSAVALSDCAIATSGDTYQNVVINGSRYSHIVDPVSGFGVTGSYRVTVIAPDGKTADSLASALTVMGPEKGLKLVENLNCVEALIVKLENGKQVPFKSSGFPDVYLK